MSSRNRQSKGYRASHVIAACALTVTGGVWGCGYAAAADASEDDTTPKPPPSHLALDVSVEGTTRRSFSGTAGLTGAPFGDLDTSGIRLLVEGNYSLYRYTNSAPPPTMINGRTVEPSAYIGYEYDADTFSLAGYVGFDRRSTSATAIDPTNQTLGTRSGAAFRVEASYNPNDATTLEAAADFATPNSAWRLDLKATHVLIGGIGVGPELISQGDTFYRQIGAGVHAQGFAFCGLNFGIGAGLIMDAREGPGAYGLVETERRF